MSPLQLHNVHFLYRPCPDFPPSMLGTCLRSSLRVTSFSSVGGSPPASNCPADGVLPRILLEKNTGISEYLWTCHLSSRLSRRWDHWMNYLNNQQSPAGFTEAVGDKMKISDCVWKLILRLTVAWVSVMQVEVRGWFWKRDVPVPYREQDLQRQWISEKRI